jgi:hypothetical protein
MNPISKKIEADILAYKKCIDSPDKRIAGGLLREAIEYVRINNYPQAEIMRKSAAPYLRFAEMVK